MSDVARRREPDEARRRDRLHQLVELARVYRGLTKGELAKELGRDISKIYCESGNPKLDYVVSLARVLDWTCDDVIDFVWGHGPPPAGATAAQPVSGYAALVEQCDQAMNLGKYTDMLDFASRAQALAATPEERARAYNLEHQAWMSLGRYSQALDAVRCALGEQGIPVGARLVLQSNLAYAYYQQWDLTSAYSICNTLVLQIENAGGFTNYADKRVKSAYGLSLRTRGDCTRRLIQVDKAEALPRLEMALADLATAARVFDELSLETEEDVYYGAYANTCRAGIRELEVELGMAPPMQALQALFDSLPTKANPADWPCSAWIDSFAWVSIFAANIVQRHLQGAELQRWMGVLTTKALDFAEVLNNWAIRERVFSLEYETNVALRRQTGLNLDLTIDEEDIRLIAGTMGRFRNFRDVGLQIFQSAKIVRSQDRS